MIVDIIHYLSLDSKTEIIFATNEESNPKALINNPVISKTFNLRRVIVKYINIAKLII